MATNHVKLYIVTLYSIYHFHQMKPRRERRAAAASLPAPASKPSPVSRSRQSEISPAKAGHFIRASKQTYKISLLRMSWLEKAHIFSSMPTTTSVFFFQAGMHQG